MILDTNLLIAWGATIKQVKKNEILFREGTTANNYYQIISGRILMYNISDDGKEFMQGYFSDGESFGEPPLFIDQPYPCTAIALKNTTIIKLPKSIFIELLQETPSLQMIFIKLLAKRVYSKSLISQILAINDAETKLLTFLKQLKGKDQEDTRILIPLTRQEIANRTGLRVETVIRTLSKLQKRNLIEIIDRKLYY